MIRTWKKIGSDLEVTGHSKYGSRPMEEAFVEANEIKEYNLVNWLDDIGYILAHGKMKMAPIRIDVPFLDHGRYFRGEHGTILAYHPYEAWCDVKPVVEEWAGKWGYIAHVLPPNASWYYPGGTCLVIVHRPEIQVVLPTPLGEDYV